MFASTFFVKTSKLHKIQLAGTVVCSGLFPTKRKLAKLAKGTGLIQRVKKITAQAIILALIQALAFSEKSSRAVAVALGMTSDTEVSRQAVWKFLRRPAVIPFLEQVIAFACLKNLKETPVLKAAANVASVLKGINRILVGDATTICLHPSLAEDFPGSKNQTAVPKAHLKLQWVMDLLTGKPIQCSLDLWNRSDMKAGLDIIALLQKGDLLMRDLGYASVEIFAAIKSAEAYFISRLKANEKVFDEQGCEIDLVSRLRQLAPRPGMTVRLKVRITNGLFPCELVVIRVPDEVANERRRKLKEKARLRGKNPPSKAYLARQDWTLMVTNVPETVADNNKIKELYLMRWRIELVFKAGKSHTGLLIVAYHKTNPNHAKALLLAWILMIILLASLDLFGLGRMREVYSSQTGDMTYELEIHEASLFKLLGKYCTLLGFYLEMGACGGDMIAHLDRTRYYDEIHNRTEKTPKRRSHSEVLRSILELEETTGIARLS